MEVTIANRRCSFFCIAESKKDRAEFRKNDKFSTSSTKEAMTVFKTRPVRILGGPNLEEKTSTPFKNTIRRCPTLKELQEKKCPFPNSDLPRMLEDLLEKGVIQLPEPKRP